MERIRKLIKKHQRELLILTLLSIIIMICFHMIFGISVSYETMFNSTDAKGYMEVKDWLLGRGTTPYTEIRPVLYPLLILIPYEISGTYGIWLLQILFWVLSINLVYLSTILLTKNKTISFISASLVLCNLSYIASCYQALTENTTTFQIAIITFTIVFFKDKMKSLNFIQTLLTLLMLMTLVKPLFFPVFLTTFFILTPIFYFREYKNEPKSLITLALILAPILIQMSIVKIQHNEFTISTIGGKTFTNYYFTQSYEQIENKERLIALDETNALSSIEKAQYIFDHSKIYFDNFFENIANNLKGHPSLLNIPAEDPPKKLILVMKSINSTFSFIHYVMLLLFILSIVVLTKAKQWPVLTIIILLGCLHYFIIITSGLSFWQGDRLTLPSMTVWPVLYSLIIYTLFKAVKGTNTILNSHQRV